MRDIQLREATTQAEYQLATILFKEYAAQLGVDLQFQNFDKELSEMAIQYSRPTGSIFIVYDDQDEALGCFGVRQLDGTICELKRMYLRTRARGQGIGRQMLAKSIEMAKALGYTKMRLDTLATMTAAVALYRQQGFYEIEAYRYNPMEGTRYFEYDLT